MIFIKNDYLKWSLSGTLMGLGFVSPNLWFLGFFGAGLFFHLVLTKKLNRHFIIGSVSAFTIKYLFATSIFWSVYPINFLPLELGKVQLFIIFIYWFTSSLWLGFGASVFILARSIWDKFFSNQDNKLLWPIIALLWVGAEILGSLIFSLMMIGEGGFLNTSYSLGYSGYLLAEHEILLQFGKVAGVYGLSFTFVFLAGLGYFLVKTRRTKLVTALLFLLLISCSWSLKEKVVTSNEDVIEVVVIDTNFDSRSSESNGDKFMQRQALLEGVSAALESNPDYLLLPEDAKFFLDEPNKNSFKTKYGDLTTIIIDSRTVTNDGGFNLEAYVYDAKNNNSIKIAKRYLVPQGEYVPVIYSNLFKLLGPAALVEYIEESINYVVGDYTSQKKLPDDTPAILFCFESVDPLGVRKLMRDHPKAPFITHPVSHAWFNQSEILWHQLDNMLKVQALWNDQYIISASNQGRSQVYTPEGNILDMEEMATGENWSVKRAVISTH